MELSDRIREIIEPTIEDMGFEIVRVVVMNGRHAKIQIMAEKANYGGIHVDQCAKISREVSALLDVNDPIDDKYTLEVSSPGMDRPLTRLKDFEHFAGFDCRIELSRGTDEGQKKFTGRLNGVIEGDYVQVVTDEGAYDLPFEDIHRAKLLLTDELIAAAQEQGS